MSVVIETTIGDITVDLYMKERPNSCLNFLKLCKIKYYNLCLFHKIEKNFIAQSGDPSGTGRGGESVFCHLYGDQAKYYDSETKPRLKHEKLGTISMVNNGNNMNGSQFFLTLGEHLTYLDELHTVFGEVVEGFDTLLKLNDAICDSSNRPYQDIRITHTVILHDPYEDPSALVIPDRSPEPTKEQLDSGYIAADEEIDDTKGKTAEEIEESIKESEAKARATILEMVGDIPDADIKPPENVLFVCKLNPVTTSEDLEIIFSRFGKILSCEVIKDRKSGESLQYAFIEFEKEEDCENAFFKMDNVLIDDRRIHVDFSQSVSKMYWEKGSKFPKSKFPQQNVILKDKARSDGYDLIFDMNDSSVSGANHDKKNKRSRSPRHKEHSLKSNRDHSRLPDGRKTKHSSESPSKDYSSSYRNYKENDRYSNSTRRSEKDYSSSRLQRSSSEDKYHKSGNYKHTDHSSYKNEYNKDRNYRSEHKLSYSKDKQYSNERLNSKSYKEYEYPKRSSKMSESSSNRYRHDSASSDNEPKKYYEEQQKSSYEHSKRMKYVEEQKTDLKEKKCKSSHKESKRDQTVKRISQKKKRRSSSTSSSSSSSSASASPHIKKKSKKNYASSDSDQSSERNIKKRHKSKSSKDSKEKKKKHKK